MIDIQDIVTYCENEKVIEYAKYACNKIKEGEYTEAFVYAGFSGMNFEDEDDYRYLALHIEQKELSVEVRVYVHYFKSSEKLTHVVNGIDEGINKWNEIF